MSISLRLFFIFVIFNSTAVNACMGRVLPNKDFDVYESIFIGQVTGIHLTEYQERMVKGLRYDNRFTSWTDTTPEYKVTVLPQRLRKGSASEVEVLKISGCGIPEPRTRQIGLFFIKPNGHVNVIFSGESYNYEDYIGLVHIYYRAAKEQLKINRG